MSFEFLCEVKLTAKQHDRLAKIAEKRGTTIEKLVREAVRNYSAMCVPTHRAIAK